MQSTGHEDRWYARPLEAALLRTLVTVAPAAAALTTAALLAPLLPAAQSTTERVGWWLLLCLISTGPLLLTDRAVRRLLPLSSLLELSMLFPDKAPSRFRIARRAAGVRNLQRVAEDARRRGVSNEPAEAAETILTLISALSHHDPRTRGHSERVHLFVDMLAGELGLSEDDRAKLRWAALVHDIGKIEVSAALLNKPGPPDPLEWELLKRHPIEGARVCVPLREWLGEWASAIEQHHERWDGQGYPLGLAGTEISRAARVVAVADAYETMTAARAYKRPLSAAAARQELARQAGSQFDPAVVRAFLNISLGRLQWRSGVLSWVAQWPLVGQLPRLGEVVAVSSVTVAGATTLVAGGLVAPGQPSFSVWRDLPPALTAAADDVPEVPPPATAEPTAPTAPPALAASPAAEDDSDPPGEPVAHDGPRDSWGQREEERPARRAAEQARAQTPSAGKAKGPVLVLAPPAEPSAPPVEMPGSSPALHPGAVPEDAPGNVPVEMPGNKPVEKPGNPDPGSGQPLENAGNEPEEAPGNKPEEPPGGSPAEDKPGVGPPAVPPGQEKPGQEKKDSGDG